jgi:predicted phage terminase large subunit-like protein
MYGGAGGGGKSVALMMAALQYVDIPGYNALLLRNSFADLNLPDSLIPISQEWLRQTPARWNESKHQWRFPSGATLTFGYMETENDRFRYRSAQFQFIGFDELTSFSKIQYTFLFSRMRRLIGLAVPIRMRSATNPGGKGHEWVKTRFIGKRLPNGEFRPVHHPDRLFIPAKMEDNPYLDVVEYRESLKELSPLERRQIEAGDWDARPEGNQFKREWFDSKILDKIPCPIKKAIRFWDLAATEQRNKLKKKSSDPDYTVGSLLCLGIDDNCYLVDIERLQGTPRKIEKKIAITAERDGFDVWVGMGQDPGAAGKIVISHYRDILKGFTLKPVVERGDKLRRSDPLASFCEGGRFFIIRGDWNEAFLEELTSFDGSGAGFDDQVDSTTNAFNLMMRSNKQGWTGQQWSRLFDKKRAHRLSNRRDIQALLIAKLRGHYQSPIDQLFPDGYPGDESEN